VVAAPDVVLDVGALVVGGELLVVKLGSKLDRDGMSCGSSSEYAIVF